MADAPDTPKPRPPAVLFALGNRDLPEEIPAAGGRWKFEKLFKHDFFAATALYGREVAGGRKELAVLKVQRTYPFCGFPMKWMGVWVARREIRMYEKLQGVRGVPEFLGRVGPTGFLHAFIPGTELRKKLPLTPAFFSELEELFNTLHARNIAYVDSNKRENILYGDDGKPWLIDFQISYELRKGPHSNFVAKWWFRRFERADWYHFYKHKTRLLPSACTPEDFEKAKKRGFWHQVHRIVARPFIVVRRRFLSRFDLANTR